MDSGNLAAAILDMRVARGQTRYQETAPIRLLAQNHEVLPGAKAAERGCSVQNCLLFPLIERVAAF